jgi:hypothetical protein
MQTIKIAAVEDVQKPSLQYRGMNPVFVLNDKDTDTWLGRNRMNCRRSGTNPVWINEMKQRGLLNSLFGEETFGVWLPRVETFKAHPEYFSLVQGKRVEKSQPCLSNPAVLAEMKKHILDFLSKNPDTELLHLGQYDYDQWCQCSNCLAMDAPQDRKVNATATWNARASTRMHKFLNELCAEIHKSHPDLPVSTYAYLQTMRPPTGITPYHGMVILYCMNSRCGRHLYEDACPIIDRARNGGPSEDDNFGAGLMKWKRFDNPLVLYSYIGDFAMGSPFPTAYLMADEIKYVKNQGMIGWLTEWAPPASGRDDWYARKLDNFIAAKLLWNTEADLGKLREDYFRKFYGKAAEPMKKQYKAFEKAWLSRTEDCAIFAKNYPFLSDAVLEEARTNLAEAKKLAAQDTPVVQERVAKDQALFDKLADTHKKNGMRASGRP